MHELSDLAGAPYQRICTNAIRREDDIWIVSSPGGPNSSAGLIQCRPASA
ncbi:hypothetical protein, variant [Sphaeroforma arctica JP610]|uniref:Uncharacterized protein n=1 Tax=Sphaeroforma arctica JP610 TaxID=667725 RepID=A0A0L0F5X8_9EUKA|nr:hypothetical protein, variant [Sphaeroforma arctica JP610]KNC72044.1 hypothetical protein, variant [Sphaeroforma arctica JP610]|eukprot:XP_014145946.1 hypothetical protein, variant [Sphaeroforma arctica JP610]